jgi:hypothetical protein
VAAATHPFSSPDIQTGESLSTCVGAGEHVGGVGWTYSAYWARMARVRIVAEVPAEGCFLPLYVFCGEQLLVSYLRPSKIDAAKHAWAILALLVKRLRRAWLNRPGNPGDSISCERMES